MDLMNVFLQLEAWGIFKFFNSVAVSFERRDM